MRTRYPDNLTESEHQFVKQWTIATAGLYGAILMAVATMAVIGAVSDRNADRSVAAATYYSSDGLAEPAEVAGLLSPSQDTDGHGAPGATPTTAQTTPDPGVARTTPQANVAWPDAGVDMLVENGWDFTNPDSIPGFGAMPSPDATASAEGRHAVARAHQ
jgi:hypothetical protein